MWYYTIDNNPQDPVDEATIAQWIANGTIQADTLVWREGMADWVAIGASELARYAAAQAAPQSAPQRPAPVRRPPGQAGGPVAATTQPATQQRQTATSPYAAPQAGPRIVIKRGSSSAMTWKKILWSFEGRIPRRTFWAGMGIWMGASLVVGIITAVLIINALKESLVNQGNPENPASPENLANPGKIMLLLIPLLLLFIPMIWSSLALGVKRWHDRGKSGWMVIINYLPLISIWGFVECGCLRGTTGPNQFGQDPT